MAFDPVALGASPVSTSASPTAEFNPAAFGATQINQNANPPLTTSQAPTEKPIGSPFIPAGQNDNAIVAPLKTIANIPSSAFNFAKGIISSLNPIEIAKHIAAIVAPNENPDAPKVSAADVLKEVPGSIYKTLVPQALQHLISGDTQSAQQDIENDPVGQIAPFLLAAEGGAKLADNYAGGLKTAAENNAANFSNPESPTYGRNIMPTKGVFEQGLDNGISKIAAPVVDTVGSGLKTAGTFAGNTAVSAASWLTGMDTATIKNIFTNPEAFTKIAQDNATRGDLAGEVKDAIDQRISDLADTGKGYETIRNMEGTVQIPPTIISDVLKNFNIELVDGKVKTGVESTPLSQSDINTIQHFVDTYGNEKQLSNNAFLNARETLSKQSNYAAGDTTNGQVVNRALRSAYDAVGKQQVPGLKELDTLYAPETKFLKQVKKDYLNKDGSFKDGAVNKIANATGVGKDNLLNRLENVMPGITKRIQLLKSVEDIERAKGIKVGNYGKIVAGGAGFLAHGVVGAIIAEIIASPTIAVPLIQGLGWTTAQVAQVLAALKIIGGDGGSLPKGVSEAIGKSLQDLQDERVAKDATDKTAAELAAQKLADAELAKAQARETKIAEQKKVNNGNNYTPTEKLPVIKMGNKPKIKSDIPIVSSETAPKVISPFQRR